MCLLTLTVLVKTINGLFVNIWRNFHQALLFPGPFQFLTIMPNSATEITLRHKWRLWSLRWISVHSTPHNLMVELEIWQHSYSLFGWGLFRKTNLSSLVGNRIKNINKSVLTVIESVHFWSFNWWLFLIIYYSISKNQFTYINMIIYHDSIKWKTLKLVSSAQVTPNSLSIKYYTFMLNAFWNYEQLGRSYHNIWHPTQTNSYLLR